MQTVFNLDLNKKNHPTSFAYHVPANTQEMYFRIVENDYVIDYSRLVRLILRFEMEDGTVYVQDTSKLSTYKNEVIVKYDVLELFLRSTGEIIITPTVVLSNKTVLLSSFKIFLYGNESSPCAETNMRNTLTSIYSFNYMLGLYYDSIKRDQINQPNGVIRLNSDGDISMQYFPDDFVDHINDKLIDTATKNFYDKNGQEIGIHGLKLDDKWRLRYYDSDDQEWYVVNSIHGGKFSYPNKSSEWNIHGGTWGTPTINAGLFTNTVNNFVDGGTFNDSLSGEVDANFIDGGQILQGDDIFGGTFK